MAMEVKGKVWECNGSLHNAEYIKWCEKERERERERKREIEIEIEGEKIYSQTQTTHTLESKLSGLFLT